MPDYDPYSGQKSRGKAQLNGNRGAGTPASAINAYQQQSKGSGDPFMAFGNLSNAWSGALARRPAGFSSGSIPAYGTVGQAQPAGGGNSTTYYDPRTGSTTTRNPNQPPRLQPNRFDYGYGPGVDPHFAPPGGGGQPLQPYRPPWEGAPAPPGSTTPFYGPGVGTQPLNVPPMVTYGGPNGTTTNPSGGFGTGGNSVVNPMALDQPFANPYFDQSRGEGGDVFGDRTFNPTQQPPPPPSAPSPRPPATPSTQPPPGRPPATPSTQPVGGPMVGQPFNNPWEGPPAPPGSTTPFYGPKPGGGRYEDGSGVGQPFNVPPMVTYGGPSGTTTNPGGGLPNPFPVSLPSGGRTVGGISPGVPSVAPPQTTPSGQPLGTGGVGRRYGPGYGGTPIAAPGEQGASGTAPTMYEWKDGKLVPVATPGSNATATPPATGTTPPSSTGTSTTTGAYGAPNNTTTFDPNVLPQSNVGQYLDPVFQDTMDKMTRQLRHEGSRTGATNSGGFIPGMTEALAPVANQFAAQKGQLMFQDQQQKADRLLDKYKFDNTQQLQAWIEKNQQELQRYGIDQNVLLGRYNADQGLAGAQAGASASMYGSDAAANASRNNAWLDYMQGMAGIGANYGLGQDRLGFDYYNANQDYGLGQQQLGYNYWNSNQGRQYEDMFNQRGYDLGMTGINRDVYGMDQAQQRYLMDLMWRMSPGGQMGGGFFPSPGVFPYGG